MKGKGKKQGKGNNVEMSLKKKRDEALRRDKEGGVGSGDSHDMVNVGGESSTIGDSRNGDEDGYIYLNPDELIADLPPPPKGKRVRVKRNLGDFTHTKVSATGEITCTCGHYKYWRWCEHCIWIDTLHFEKYPKHPKVALACDQWHIIRSKFLAVLGEVHIKC